MEENINIKENNNTNICLLAKDIVKVFPGTKALDNVTFKVYKGKVNALIGENGAGKSTLMKILAGIERPTEGKLFLYNEEIELRSPIDAEKNGIGMIHQEINFFPDLTIEQNMFMGVEEKKNTILVNRGIQKEKCNKILAELGHPFDVEKKMGELSVGQQQIVEIARHLLQPNLKILIMDEPTSSLTVAEVSILFKLINKLKEKGISIIYISHRLEEIMEISDYITVLRDGKKVAEDLTKNVNVSWIISNMVGSEKQYKKREKNFDIKTENILEVENLSLMKKNNNFVLKDISLKLKKGEILGIYGLLGSGRTEFLECIMGINTKFTGNIKLYGKPIKIENIAQQIKNGFVMVPEDRQRNGLVQTLNIAKNISLSSLNRFSKFGILRNKEEDLNIDKMVNGLRIKVADKSLPILSLSGGNQQKVIIGRGLLTMPKVLLLDEPTRGIDVAAKSDVYEIIDKLAKEGISIIVVSSELEEILNIADRVIVFSNGRMTGEFVGDEITKEALVEASYKGLVNLN